MVPAVVSLMLMLVLPLFAVVETVMMSVVVAHCCRCCWCPASGPISVRLIVALLGILRAVSVATFDLARLGCCHQRCFHFW
jgi:hypothetical protein